MYKCVQTYKIAIFCVTIWHWLKLYLSQTWNAFTWRGEILTINMA